MTLGLCTRRRTINWSQSHLQTMCLVNHIFKLCFVFFQLFSSARAAFKPSRTRTGYDVPGPGLGPGKVYWGVSKLKSFGIKPAVIDIILEWDQLYGMKHFKFERTIVAENGLTKRQILSCSTTSSDYQWARVVGRDFLKREAEKKVFLAANRLGGVGAGVADVDGRDDEDTKG